MTDWLLPPAEQLQPHESSSPAPPYCSVSGGGGGNLKSVSAVSLPITSAGYLGVRSCRCVSMQSFLFKMWNVMPHLLGATNLPTKQPITTPSNLNHSWQQTLTLCLCLCSLELAITDTMLHGPARSGGEGDDHEKFGPLSADL